MAPPGEQQDERIHHDELDGKPEQDRGEKPDQGRQHFAAQPRSHGEHETGHAQRGQLHGPVDDLHAHRIHPLQDLDERGGRSTHASDRGTQHQGEKHHGQNAVPFGTAVRVPPPFPARGSPE